MLNVKSPPKTHTPSNLTETPCRPLIWVIGGSDNRAGAGIQADLLTANNFNVACCTIITAVTAQNTQCVNGIFPVAPDALIAQLNTLADDALPSVIKMGLIANQAQVTSLAHWLSEHSIPVILDPVQIASNKQPLTEEPVDLTPLLPFCTLITPNTDELLALGNLHTIAQHSVQSLLLTGTLNRNAYLVDQYYDLKHDNHFSWTHPHINSTHTHGTGCTLATAIAAGLALQYPIEDAITQAIAYVRKGLHPNTLAQHTHAVTHQGWPQDFYDWPVGKDLSKTSSTLTSNSSATHHDAIEFLPLTQSLGFYPVVESVVLLEQLLQLGVRTVQLRIKNFSCPTQLRNDIQLAIQLGQHYHAQVFINDHWQLACELGAYGVHLGQSDIAQASLTEIANVNLRLGISTHGFFELSMVRNIQPSYFALGHIFPTTTKKMPSQPQGLDRLKKTMQLIQKYPSVAIGGIDLNNAESVLLCGVNSIAVVRAITESANIARTLQQFLFIFDRLNIDANIHRESVYAALSKQ